MSTATLHLNQLEGGYPGHRVLRPTNLTATHGDIVLITGPNGAGKTTLINAIAGHVLTSGQIWVDGQDISRWPADRRARAGIALVPQHRGLFAGLTAAEHLRLATTDASAVDDVLDRLPHLRTRLRHRPSQLSGGEQQMLAIARALVRSPRLLLLDEPAEGLAATVVGELVRVIADVAAAGGTVLVTEPGTGTAAWPDARHHELRRGLLTPVLAATDAQGARP
ncbi:ABC transporter ATP-binding protein [Catellatospora bangladeshensis]|uniref:ABC transporter ATP-binding protein n=1 Tax=Catellatospora bangladeshensis TaxID=310355 RepID=A0A8J3JJM3_9ACTN|nr:ATP-binding cassette domain-containing protein [Catellatospora bangladeshensis]GIF86046.1 ABC transporter ATP-binding protein [Catellatospora bangladeshensis]